MPNNVMNVGYIAERYGVTRETVLSWITNGLLDAVDVAPAKCKKRHYRIQESALVEFERKRRSVPDRRSVLPANIEQIV